MKHISGLDPGLFQDLSIQGLHPGFFSHDRGFLHAFYRGLANFFKGFIKHDFVCYNLPLLDADFHQAFLYIAPLFAQLRILPLDHLIKLCTLKNSCIDSLIICYPGHSMKLGSQTENVIPTENFLMLMIYMYIPAHNYATLKRMPLFNFPLVWNGVGIEKNNSSKIYLSNIKEMRSS